MVSVCSTCQGLQKHLKPLGTSSETNIDRLQWVNASLASLRSSGTTCPACALLLCGILQYHDRFADISEDRVRLRAESFPSIPGRTNQDHLSVEVRWKEQHEHVGYPDLKLEFYTDGVGQSSFSAIGQGRPSVETPLQGAGLSAAKYMIENCKSNHSRCQKSTPTTLPKRILDVMPSLGSKSVVLKESRWSENDQRYEYGEYVALSHVWGTRNHLTTTKSNMNLHLKGIPWWSLPKMFQEAVMFTRAMNVRYLWIDSLCLVQDDIQVKLEESVRMDEIFGNAYLTIAATSATNSSTQSLFPIEKRPFKIQATDSKGKVLNIYVREQPSHYSFKAPSDEGSHMNGWGRPFNMSAAANSHTPLLKRAWAYTERLLSPCVLHFTKSEMILECREGYSCECGRIDDSTFDSRATDSTKQKFGRIISEANTMPQIDGNSTRTHRRKDDMASQLANTMITSGSVEFFKKREDTLQLWSNIITEFSARKMNEDERLLAMTGIAKALQPAMRSGYIAGQWTFSTLSLLWYPEDSTVCRRPSPMDGQNIPTWSWASCEGSPILFDNTSAMDLACRVSFGPKGKRASAWSPIQGEPLTLAAAMVAEVILHALPGSEKQNYTLTKNRIAVDFTPDIMPPQGEDALQDGETLVCVLISMTYRSSIAGLVLKEADNNIYRRVGRFECYDCRPEDGTDEMRDDAEALFAHWFPEIPDMTQLDFAPHQHFSVI